MSPIAGRAALRLASFAFLATVAIGCGMGNKPSPRMSVAEHSVLTPAPDAATVVFVRPSGYAGVIIPALYIDGKYVADLEAQTRFVTKIPPGTHTFVATMPGLTKGCRQMTATVEANKLYFVESATANGSDLFAVHPADAARAKPWLAVPERTLNTAALATAPVDEEDRAKCFEKANAHAQDADSEHKAKTTLTPADGFVSAP